MYFKFTFPFLVFAFRNHRIKASLFGYISIFRITLHILLLLLVVSLRFFVDMFIEYGLFLFHIVDFVDQFFKTLDSFIVIDFA